MRVNLVSVGREVTEEELGRELETYAKLIRPLGWALQLYIPMKSVPMLERIVPGLGVKVVLDHFASPTLPKDAGGIRAVGVREVEGMESLLRLMEAGSTWVKVSGWYRISRDGEGKMRDLDVLAKEVIGARGGTRCVWASDWPHTRFETVDVGGFVERCWGWCDEVGGGVGERLFVENAKELFDVR